MSDYLLGYFVPFHRLELHTALDRAEICSRLQSVTDPKWPWFRWPGDKSFVGKVSQDGFRLIRVVKGRNSYNPWLLAKVSSASSGGSSIGVVMTVHPISAVLMLAFAVFALRPLLTGQPWWWVPPSLVVVFHLAMCDFGFVPEARRSENLLRQLLAAGQEAPSTKRSDARDTA
jgi:hypothetical protein